MSAVPPGSPLTSIVTTDLGAITRGRAVAAKRFDEGSAISIGWLPANISLTPFNGIATPNPWGSIGDLRLVADASARYWTQSTGAATPFDMVIGDIVELDGTPWTCCPRTILREAQEALKAATGLTMIAAFEQEFQIIGVSSHPAHCLSFEALRRLDPFGPMFMAALAEAGVEPETFLPEFGDGQFEITCRPAEALVAADRAVAIREIAREIARAMGWRASFTPKSRPDAVGAGVHIHFSFHDASGNPATYHPDGPGGLAPKAEAFCAGILRHMSAIVPFTASSVPSYYRLRPHNWSASYTWLAERNREATLRICPTTSVFGQKSDGQFNIEYRAADATANPYLAMAAIIRAGLEGIITEARVPAFTSDDPTTMMESQREALGLRRLPETLADAVAALRVDPIAVRWFNPRLVTSFEGVKAAEIAATSDKTPDAICEIYGAIY
jgi:glutamine synthetase